jgi:site-specific DNA-methyltransferase (adenine-specific)
MALKPTKEQKERSRVTKEEWREFTKTVWHIPNTSHPDHPAVFPEEIPRRLIKLFSFVDEWVLDPFAGTGVTGVAALSLDRRALMAEQNAKYVAIIREQVRGSSNGKGQRARVIHGDSRDLDVKSDSVGLIVTSPPYWNKADYGDGKSNLGNTQGYRDFFSAIRPVFEESLRVLAPGRKLCLVTANVNQFTDHGLLTFPLAADFLTLLREVGFVVVGEIIWSKDGTGGRWGSWGSQRPIFGSYPFPPNFLFKTVHEHILVVSKPPQKLRRAKGSIALDELMAPGAVDR